MKLIKTHNKTNYTKICKSTKPYPDVTYTIPHHYSISKNVCTLFGTYIFVFL